MPGLTLGGVEYALSNVYAPCRTARVTVAGSVVPGAPEVDESGPSSTAFLAVTESWTRTDPGPGPGPDSSPSPSPGSGSRPDAA
jgi:hypothetical protein